MTTSRKPIRSSSRTRSSADLSPITFYERGQPYFEFTNFAEFPILLDGKTWPTSEHYFQAQKFVGTPYVEQIRNLPRPRDAFDLSRQPQVSQWLRSDWEQVKLHVMHKALQAKFSQHSHLRDMLVKTGDRQLIEHTTRDSFWGDGGDGRGQNHLGKLLMTVRSELSSADANLSPIDSYCPHDNSSQTPVAFHPGDSFSPGAPTCVTPSHMATFGTPRIMAASGTHTSMTNSGAPKRMATSGAPKRMATSGAPSSMTTSGTHYNMTNFGAPKCMATSAAPSSMTTCGTHTNMTNSGAPKRMATSAVPNNATAGYPAHVLIALVVFVVLLFVFMYLFNTLSVYDHEDKPFKV